MSHAVNVMRGMAWTKAQWTQLFLAMIQDPRTPPAGRVVPHPLLWDGAMWLMWVIEANQNGGLGQSFAERRGP